MKKLMFVLALVVLLAFTGSVMATQPIPTSGTTVITGNVEACSIGLTVPVDQSITLTRGNDNVQGLGNVQIINNCDTPWTISVTADNANMYFNHPVPSTATPITYTYLTTVMSVSTDGTNWVPFAPATLSGLVPTNPITLASGHGATSVPVYVKQPVTTSDAGGQYTIKFTFSLTQG
jgi:hypothetical protein